MFCGVAVGGECGVATPAGIRVEKEKVIRGPMRECRAVGV